LLLSQNGTKVNAAAMLRCKQFVQCACLLLLLLLLLCSASCYLGPHGSRSLSCLAPHWSAPGSHQVMPLAADSCSQQQQTCHHLKQWQHTQARQQNFGGADAYTLVTGTCLFLLMADQI
jgi:hypothetical protein